MEKNSQNKKNRGDSGLSGQLYEIYLCTYIYLEASRRIGNNQLDDFFISSNVNDSGAIDDVVYKIVYTDENGQQHTHVRFIQTKHKLSQSRNLTLEKLFADGNLKLYHDGFRGIKKQFEKNKNDDPIFSTDFHNVDVILMTNASLGQAIKHETLKKFKIDQNDFFRFDENNVFYKLDTNISCKVDNKKDSVNIMEVLNDENECREFVKNLVTELISTQEENLASKLKDSYLSKYKKPLLEEIISIGEPGVGIINPTLSKDVKSPFVRCFLEEMKTKSFEDVRFSLPLDFGTLVTNPQNETVLPYTRKYFEEFLNVFKIYIEQPNEHDFKKHILTLITQHFSPSQIEAKDNAVVIVAKVREWWEDKSLRINYLNKKSNIITETIEFSISFNVCNSTRLFTGRIEKLQEFHSMIREWKLCVVNGLGGIGKTEFTRRYIEEFGKYYKHNIVWINAQDQNKIINSFQSLVETKLTFIKCDEGVAFKIIKETFEYFCNKTCLFVFDNAENTVYFQNLLSVMEEYKEWKPYIMITSRDGEWPSQVKTLKLDVLEIKEAIALIKNGLSIDCTDENMEINDSEEDITSLAETLQRFPLALQQAISYISSERLSENYFIKTYIKDFNKNEEKLLDSESSDIFDDYKNTTFKTWMITINKIESYPNYGVVAMLIFRIIAFCAPNNICSTMFLRLLNSAENDIKEGIRLLVKYSMVNENDDKTQLSIHRLVQEVTKIRLKKDRKEQGNVLNNALTVLDKNINKETLEHALVLWTFISQHLVEIQDGKTFIESFGHNFKTIIDFSFKESRFDEAITFSKMALAMLNNQFKPNHVHIIDVECEYGKLLIRTTKFDLAKELYEKVLEKIPIDNIEKRYEVKSQIATIESQKSNYDIALKLFEDLLDKVNKDLGQYHSTTIRVKEGIANILKRKGFYNASLSKFEEIQETLTKQEKMGDANFDFILLLQAKANVASCHKYLGRYEKALSMFNEILKVQRDKFGERNAMTLRTLNNIGVVYIKQGKFDEALELFKKSLEVKKALYSEASSSILVTKHNLASIYFHLPPEKLEEGLKLMKEAAEGRKALHSPTHKSTLNSLKKVAQMLHRMGKYKEALIINQNAYNEILQLHKNKEHPQALEFYVNIAKVNAAQGNRQKALAMIEEVLNEKITNKDFGPSHPDTLTVMYDKAEILSDMGNTNEAINLLYIVENEMLRCLGKHHSSYETTVQKLKELENVARQNVSTKSVLLRCFNQIKILFIVYILFKLFNYLYYHDTSPTAL